MAPKLNNKTNWAILEKEPIIVLLTYARQAALYFSCYINLKDICHLMFCWVTQTIFNPTKVHPSYEEDTFKPIISSDCSFGRHDHGYYNNGYG